tara:strand:+ start:1135 stop:1671 length:537 start_codon:yes stop_codon:yes gene_type:complete
MSRNNEANMKVVNATIIPNSELPIVQPIIPNDEIPLTNRAILTYNLSKSVKLFTLLDGFFCFIYAVYNPYYFFPLLLTVIGYYGAKNYNKTFTIIYLLYCVLNIVSKVILWVFIMYFQERLSNYDYIGFSLFTWLSILCELYISRIICKYYDSLCILTDSELQSVKNLKYRIAQIVYW